MDKKAAGKFRIILITLIAVLCFGGMIYQYAAAQNYRAELSNQYSKSFYELAEALKNIEVSLDKGLIISNPSQMVRLSNEISRKTQLAKASVTQLPLEEAHVDTIVKFLSQTGDFVYTLAMKMVGGDMPTDTDYENLKLLSKYAAMLNEAVNQTEQEINSGRLSVSDMSVIIGKKTQSIDLSMLEIEKQFEEYPSLVYDGPFSSHIDSLQSKMLQDKPEISREEAVERAKWFLNIKDAEYEITHEVGGNLASYGIACYPEGRESGRIISIDISKAGGCVVWYLDNISVGEAKTDIYGAKRAAEEFLHSKGYTAMKDSYYEVDESIATINYAYTQDGVIMYPDLIKVKVALDTGRVVGMEAKGYIMSHEEERTLPEPGIDEYEILSRVPEGVTVNTVGKAVIPSDSMEEIFCYEAKCVVDDKNYLIYFDAQTGEEIKILLLIESENGVLTI